MKKANLFLVLSLITSISTVNAQTVGTAAPDFTVDLLEGGQFTLSEQAGKVVLLYFFGNGCPFCVSAGPQVESVYTNFKSNDNFAAVGLDTWGGSNETSVGGFKSASGVSFPLGMEAKEVETSFNITYDRLAVIDQQGVLQHKGNTAAGNDIATVTAVINDLFETTSARNDIASVSLATVFPNPAGEKIQFTLNSKDASSVSLYIYDLTGKEKKKETFDSMGSHSTLSYDISDLKAGAYIYKLKFNDQFQAGTLIIR